MLWYTDLGWPRGITRRNVLLSIDAIDVSYIIIGIFKVIFTLINLMAIISYKHVTVAVIKIYLCTVNNGYWINDGPGVIVYLTFYDVYTVNQQPFLVCAPSVLRSAQFWSIMDCKMVLDSVACNNVSFSENHAFLLFPCTWRIPYYRYAILSILI